MMGRGGMMGGAGMDSTNSAVMRVVHELMTNHDKLRRSVTNLPNGVYTITESDDAEMVRQIKAHVAGTGGFVAKGVDPNLPMSTPALHGVLKNGTRINRVVQETATGVVVTETSADSTTVALLQAHAAEITDLVKRGMAAMHETMMGAPSAPAAIPAATAAAAATAATAAKPVDPAQPTRAGQEAFATIGEIVRILDADPRTDWSKVNIEALRQHLMDMDDVTMRADVRSESVDGGATFDVRGTGRVREAIRRMAMSHGATISPSDGFSWTSVESAEGARVTVRATTASDVRMVNRIRALGFVGILTLGDHHTVHHLGIASGTMGAHHHH
jgi:hypothetical protein